MGNSKDRMFRLNPVLGMGMGCLQKSQAIGAKDKRLRPQVSGTGQPPGVEGEKPRCTRLGYRPGGNPGKGSGREKSPARRTRADAATHPAAAA